MPRVLTRCDTRGVRALKMMHKFNIIILRDTSPLKCLLCRLA